jgi:hypothetical protein
MFWDKKRKAQLAEEASLEPAFAQLELFGAKLDEFRIKLNENARALASIKPDLNVSVPTPNPLIPHVPRPSPKPEGLYSINGGKKPEKRSHGSGRFYIQLGNTKDAAALTEARDQIAKCGRVVDSGKGTASDPDASWLEVAVRLGDTESFLGKLGDVKDRVEKLIAVEPGEGRTQAKQLDLFHSKQGSGAGV